MPEFLGALGAIADVTYELRPKTPKELIDDMAKGVAEHQAEQRKLKGLPT